MGAGAGQSYGRHTLCGLQRCKCSRIRPVAKIMLTCYHACCLRTYGCPHHPSQPLLARRSISSTRPQPLQRLHPSHHALEVAPRRGGQVCVIFHGCASPEICDNRQRTWVRLDSLEGQTHNVGSSNPPPIELIEQPSNEAKLAHPCLRRHLTSVTCDC